MNKKYDSTSIKVLSDRDHVRQRMNVYAGNTVECEYDILMFDNMTPTTFSFVPAAYKVIGEILDNSVDEFAQITQRNKTLTISSNEALGEYEISDNGRGVPIDIHETGKYTPEVVFGALRSGRNFENDKAAGVQGQNGMGSAITMMASTTFSVMIKRDNKTYTQHFEDGGLSISNPIIKNIDESTHGTTIRFQLDETVFANSVIPTKMMQNRAMELALTNNGLVVQCGKKKYKFKNGFSELFAKNNTNFIRFEHNGYEIFAILNPPEDKYKQITSFVNSSYLFEGGICNTQIINAFNDLVVETLSRKAKVSKCVVTKQDIDPRVMFVCNLKISDPMYDNQAKTRLTGPNLKTEYIKTFGDTWKKFTKLRSEWFDGVLESAVERHHRDANNKAIKQHKKKLKVKPEGVTEANSKDRSKCRCFITEGISAASLICEVRNTDYDGILPLTGKINNVYDSTPAEMLRMKKIEGLLHTLGLTPGVPVERNELRYGSFIIATDADYDGGNIMALLVNLFNKWPDLFNPEKPPVVYHMIAPNVCLIKGKERIHFRTQAEYAKVSDDYVGYTVKYFKGLGAMNKVDWEMVMGNDDLFIPIQDNDGTMADTMKLLFSENVHARKEWLCVGKN